MVVIGEAGSGEQALALADAMEIDLMLVDVGMKGMNGIQLASALLARHPHIKVLMLSTYDNRPRGYVLKESRRWLKYQAAAVCPYEFIERLGDLSLLTLIGDQCAAPHGRDILHRSNGRTG